MLGENLSDETYQVMTRFWDSATDVARACQLVAHRLRYTNEDMAYMLGLFHNAGIPLLMQRFSQYPAVMSEAYQLPVTRIVDRENQQLETNHAVVSFYAARSWKLPPMICRIISQHHNTRDIFANDDDNDEKTLLGILKLGEHIAGLHRTLANQEEDLEWQQSREKILEYLGLSEVDYEDLVAYAADQGIGGQTYFM